MLKKLEVNIYKNALFNKTDKLLVAFSGGVDSVVLTDLLSKAGYQIELAHCNFQLRGKEAIDDTAFCKSFADSMNVPFHLTCFNTKDYAAEHKISIQMAARDLRYNWFKSLKKEYDFDYILTAHHANDNVETLFVNLIRGTGIKGLQGIPEKQNFIARPLLFATKDDIREYAAKNHLLYREDSSNQEVKYKRNFIRHQILPELKILNPSLEETIHTSIQFFKQSSEIVTEYAKMKYLLICKEENNLLYIDINLLLAEKQKETLLFEWLYPKQFKTIQIQQLTEVLISENNTGKQFSTASHELVIDRKFIVVQKIDKENSPKEFLIHSMDDSKYLPVQFYFEETKLAEFSDNKNKITIAYNDHLFPLTLRRWKIGDKFKPFGMNGFKKLSDFFKDHKLSLFEKENVWILENKEHIIWIVGYRMDDRCKVVAGTEKLLKISFD
ncbi:MAG: tRNA lysidine(34) synthetase TilS [Burkholderiales bacterium]|nr:tRNA lysidine(34) synthetase TilS [Bacteroidia bacterium]